MRLEIVIMNLTYPFTILYLRPLRNNFKQLVLWDKLTQSHI